MKIVYEHPSITDTFVTKLEIPGNPTEYKVYMDADPDNIAGEKPVRTYHNLKSAQDFLEGAAYILMKVVASQLGR